MLPFDLPTWMLVFTRLGAFLAMAPVFSSPNLPVRLKITLAAGGAALIAPGIQPADLGDRHWLTLMGCMAVEIGIGALLGFITKMIFFALEFAGTMISMEIGLNLHGALNPFSRDRADTLSMVVSVLGVLLLLTLNMHHAMIAGVQMSYSLAPAGSAALQAGLLWNLVDKTTGIFEAGLLMAAPLAVVTLLVALIMTILGRAVPQMNVFGESMGFRSLAGLAMMGITLSLMAQHISNGLRRIPEDMVNVMRLLAP